MVIDHADRMLDWKHMIAAIERSEPIHEPGAKTGYHGLTYGFLVGEILQREGAEETEVKAGLQVAPLREPRIQRPIPCSPSML